MTGHDFFILPESSYLSATVSRVKVRFAPNGSRWRSGALYRSQPGTRPYEIVAGGRRLLTGGQAKAKLEQQRIE